MTPLTKPVHRLTKKKVGTKPIVITVAPLRGQDEAMIYLRRLGERTSYPITLSDIYRLAALWYGQREQAARRKAKKEGVPWRRARLQFVRENSPPQFTQPDPDNDNTTT